jgi:hypothetical protein
MTFSERSYRVVVLFLAKAYIRLRQTSQRQAGEASVRGSAEDAPEGHWGVLLCLWGLTNPSRRGVVGCGSQSWHSHQ